MYICRRHDIIDDIYIYILELVPQPPNIYVYIYILSFADAGSACFPLTRTLPSSTGGTLDEEPPKLFPGGLGDSTLALATGVTGAGGAFGNCNFERRAFAAWVANKGTLGALKMEYHT